MSYRIRRTSKIDYQTLTIISKITKTIIIFCNFKLIDALSFVVVR